MNVYFGKQTVKLKKDFTKVSKVGLPFHILTSIYATLNFWLSFRLVLLWKWNNNYPKTIQCKKLLRKTAKTCQFMRKKVLLKQTKKFKTLWSRDLWRHVPVLVLKKKSSRKLLSHKFSLLYVKRLILYSPWPSLPTSSLMFITPLTLGRTMGGGGG